MVNVTTVPIQQFHVSCRDSHAKAVGIEGNSFRSRCQCISGFQSSNPNKGKMLSHRADVCVLCSDVTECGEAPSESPTLQPTVSTVPSEEPTLSKAPTYTPTISSMPSSTVPSQVPTATATVSVEPTAQPTSPPTGYISVFDGNFCRVSIECISGMCKNSICTSHTLLLHVRADSSSSRVSSSNNLHRFGNWDNVGSKKTTKKGPLKSGGTTVLPTNELLLSGDVYEIFNLTHPLSVNRFSKLKLDVAMNGAVEYLGVCLFETLPMEFNIYRNRCHEIKSSSTIEVDIGKLLDGKRTEVRFAGFLQEASKASSSKLSHLNIFQGEVIGLFDEIGNCRDQSANTIHEGDGSLMCVCKDGHISSGGGKRQQEMDSCIDCIRSELCLFDGERCSQDGDCFANSCMNGVCESKVSMIDIE